MRWSTWADPHAGSRAHDLAQEWAEVPLYARARPGGHDVARCQRTGIAALKSSGRSARAGRLGSDDGSGTLLVVGAVAWVVAIGLAAMVVGAALHTRTSAAAAADLAALAGASAALGGTEAACREAAVVAHANGARLTSCEVSGVTVTVRAATRIPDPLRRWVPGVDEIDADAHAELVPRTSRS